MNTDTAPPPGLLQRVLVGRNPKRTLTRILALVVVTFVVFRYLLLPIRVNGGSMLPTYRENGVNFVNRLAYLFGEPRRGDVVAIRLLAGEHVMYMKRIVGLPGETVAFHQGRLYINGELQDEPYVKFPCYWEREPMHLEPGHYYVVGDNRDMFWGDHVQGRVGRDHIVGKLLL